jgi:hypothetical protein
VNAEDHDALCTASIDWFHRLADLGAEQIAARYSPESLARLKAHMALFLDGAELPVIWTPAQFAETVLDLRSNETDWNRATMWAIIRADDLMLAGQTEEAVQVLLAFAASCPWVSFREAAENQAGLLPGRVPGH